MITLSDQEIKKNLVNPYRYHGYNLFYTYIVVIFAKYSMKTVTFLTASS